MEAETGRGIFPRTVNVSSDLYHWIVNESENAEGNWDPIETIRKLLRRAEFEFEEDEGVFSFGLTLLNVECAVIATGVAQDLVIVVAKLPVRAVDEVRPLVGEFLHRLNFSSLRKFWEMDYDDGEIRVATYLDAIMAPVDTKLLGAAIGTVATQVGVAFPYLTSVLSRGMTPDFAADQALAAFEAESAPLGARMRMQRGNER